jgi:hypothetical protein
MCAALAANNLDGLRSLLAANHYFEFMPELHWAFGYPWALGLMVVITIIDWLLPLAQMAVAGLR